MTDNDKPLSPAEVINFIQNKMRMSHIYQPLMIRSLIESGGSSTIRQMAQKFLAEDESQIRYYEGIVKRWPVDTLKRHRIIDVNGELISLNVQKLDYSDQVKIRSLCDTAMADFLKDRGLDVFRMEADQVTGSARIEALEASKGHCALCGVSSKDRPLDVDHIRPRSKGGKTEASNLQVLCSTCNRSKRDQSTIDYKTAHADRIDQCEYCNPGFAQDAFLKYGTAVVATEPQDGSFTITPSRHTATYLSISQEELSDVHQLAQMMIRKLGSNAGQVGITFGASPGKQHSLIEVTST